MGEKTINNQVMDNISLEQYCSFLSFNVDNIKNQSGHYFDWNEGDRMV